MWSGQLTVWGRKSRKGKEWNIMWEDWHNLVWWKYFYLQVPIDILSSFLSLSWIELFLNSLGVLVTLLVIPACKVRMNTQRQEKVRSFICPVLQWKHICKNNPHHLPPTKSLFYLFLCFVLFYGGKEVKKEQYSVFSFPLDKFPFNSLHFQLDSFWRHLFMCTPYHQNYINW